MRPAFLPPWSSVRGCLVAFALTARSSAARATDPSLGGWKPYGAGTATHEEGEEDDADAPAAATTSALPGGAVRLPAKTPKKRAPVTGGAELDLSARHLWRGIALGRGGVLEPSAWIASRGLVLAASADVGVDDGPQGADTLLGPMVRYDLELAGLRIEPALVAFWFPNRPRDTTFESSLEVSFALGNARWKSDGHLDVSKHLGAFFGTLGVEHVHVLTPELRARWFVDVGVANAAFNAAYLETPVTAVDVVELGASLRTELTDVLFVSFHTELSNLVAPSLRSWAARPSGSGAGGAALVNGGVTLGVEL